MEMSLPSDWQINKKNVSERGEYLLETGQWSDCEFIVGQEPEQKRFKGHKLFLAMSSPVFEAMFFGSMAEKVGPIPVRDIQPDVFEALLDYIYTDSIQLDSFEDLCELCYCAKKYMLPSLIEHCIEILSSDLSPNNALRAYQIGKLFEEPVVMQESLKIICCHTREVLNEPTWEEIELETLVLVFEQDALEIDSEIELYSALEHWTKAECLKKSLDYNDKNALRSAIGSALFKIRFLTLTPQEFADGVRGSSLLTQDEAFRILMKLSCTESEMPMPEGFSTNTSRRTKLLTSDSIAESAELKQDLPLPATYICRIHLTELFYHYYDRNEREGTVTFRVDKDISFLGIQVPTCADIGKDEVPYIYTHKLRAILFDSNMTELAHTDVSKEALMNTLIEVKFHPIYIQRYKIYTIKVIDGNRGRYTTGHHTPNMVCGSVAFTVTSSVTSSFCFIRSIIFNYPPNINSRYNTNLQRA